MFNHPTRSNVLRSRLKVARLKVSIWLLLGLFLASQAGCLPAPPLPIITPAPTLESTIQQAEPPAGLKARLVPGETAELAMWSAGRVETVSVWMGECVPAGTVLLRLESYPAYIAQVRVAELELIQAQQAFDDLQRNAQVALAQAELALAQAEDRAALTRDLYASKIRPPANTTLEQAEANLRLADKQLARLQDDLAQVQNRYDNPDSPIWMFTNRRTLRLQITNLESQVAAAERRVLDAQEKVDDLREPPDDLEVAVAQRDMQLAEAERDRAQSERDDRLARPDPQALELVTARLYAAQAALAAARIARQSAELVAPFAGCVVDLDITAGEWVQTGQPVLTLADQAHWTVETVELDEFSVPQLQEGQPAQVTLDAYPDLLLPAKVESIAQTYTRVDDEIYYQVRLNLEEVDPRLRWGLTARVDFEAAGAPQSGD